MSCAVESLVDGADLSRWCCHVH